MDSACYDSTDNLIIGVRGGRVFKLNATTGAVIGSGVDFQQLGLSPASVCWDSVNNKCWAVCWNTGNIDTSTGVGVRNLYRIVPSTLTVDLVTDIASTFTVAIDTLFQAGIGVLKAVGSTIYGMGNTSGAIATVFRFGSPAVSAPTRRTFGGEYPSFAYASIGGNDRVYFNAVSSQDVEWWDFTGTSHGNGPLDAAHNRLSIEYAPTQGNFYIPEELQFIDVYDNTGTFVSQINTGRAAFNGVNIKYNSVDSLLYIAGGADNTVCVLNPATDTFTIKTGFDLPWDFVFTATKKFAIQQGSIPLKEIT